MIPIISTVILVLGMIVVCFWSFLAATDNSKLTSTEEIMVGFFPTYFFPTYMLASAVALKFIWS